MVGVEWDEDNQLFIPFFRKVIPRGEFTYQNAVEAIKNAHYEFDFDYMMIDAGHGENQIEQLHIWAAKAYGKKFAERINRVHFSEKVKVWDPVTKKVEKKDIKPFMVNNAVLMFERERMVLNPRDKETIAQFEAYEVKSWGTGGRPTYTDENEHILDCIVLALYGFTKYYDDILKVTKATAIHVLQRPLDRMDSNVKERGIKKETLQDRQNRRVAASLGLKPNPMARSGGYQSVRRSMGVPSRKMF